MSRHSYIVIKIDVDAHVDANTAVEGRGTRVVLFEGSFASVSMWRFDLTYDMEEVVLSLEKRTRGVARPFTSFTAARRHVEVLAELEFKLTQAQEV